MDENLELRFGATAAGVEPVTSGIIAQLEKIAASSAMIEVSTSKMATSMAGVTPHATATAQAVEKVGHNANVAANSFMGMLEQMEHVRRKVGEVAELFAAAFAVEQIAHTTERILEWGEAHARASEHIEQESQRLGISTTQMQQWNAVATMTGRDGGELTAAFSRLEISVQRATNAHSAQAAALRQLGINAAAAGTPQELLIQIANRYAAMPDGFQKNAISAALMGRAGTALTGVLNEGGDAMARMMQTADQYGTIMDESMIARNLQIAETLNTSKLAMEGLGNTLFSSLGPVLQDVASGFNDLARQIIQSYREGGTAKTVFDSLGSAIRGIVTFVAAFAGIIIAFFLYMKSGVEAFVAVIETGWEYVKSQCRQLEITFETLGHVIYDSLTSNILAATQHVSEGLAAMNAEVASSISQMSGLVNNPWMVSSNQAAHAGDSVLAGTGRFVQHMIGPRPENPPVGPPHRRSSTAVAPLGGRGGGHHGGGESQVGQWEQELHQMEMASGEYFKDQTQTELAFWQQHLAMTTEGSKTWYEVQTKIFTLSRNAAHEHYQEQVAELDFEIQAQRGHYDQMAAIEARKVELVRNTYGENSRQYQDVLREQLRMQMQHEEELRAIVLAGLQQRSEIETQATQTRLQQQTDALGMERNMVQYAVNAGTMTRIAAAQRNAELDQQEYADQLQAANREHDILMMRLQAQIETQGISDQQRHQYQEQMTRADADFYNRLEQMDSAHNVKLQQDALATANAYRDTWLSRLQPIEQGLTQMVNGFLTSTQNLRSAILQFGSSILQAVNSWVMRWVTMHIAGEQAKTASTVAGNIARTASESAANATGMAMTAKSAVAEITTHGAVAAAGALRAISHIPIIGPFIAPAIAAGILALAMGFISRVASAEGGWGQVPTDGMLTQLHKDEMVLPASIAGPLRTVLSGNMLGAGFGGLGSLNGAGIAAGGPGGGISGGREGDIHLHVHAMDGRSVKNFLMDNRHALADVLRKAARDNV